MAKTYHYFVSYVFPGAFGRCEIKSPTPIRTIDDIKDAERSIMEIHGPGSPCPDILFFKLLRVEEDEDIEDQGRER